MNLRRDWDQDKAYRELTRLHDLHGDQFSPESVTTAIEEDRGAAPEVSRHLEWDQAVAAHRYRCEQVRHILAEITVVFTDSPGEAPQRAFYPVRRTAEEGDTTRPWRTAPEIRAVHSDLEQVLGMFEGQIRALAQRYRDLAPDSVHPMLLKIAAAFGSDE